MTAGTGYDDFSRTFLVFMQRNKKPLTLSSSLTPLPANFFLRTAFSEAQHSSLGLEKLEKREDH
jgi:hypothetical protein